MKNPTLIINSKFPINTDGIALNSCYFNFLGNESAMLIWKIKNPTKLELQKFNYGNIKIGIYQYDKVAFFCIDQEEFMSGDSSFHYAFTELKDKHIKKASNDIGLPIYLCVVDDHNILKALRCININKKVTDDIARIIEYQRSDDGMITPQEYQMIVLKAYKINETTEDMFNKATSIYQIKGKLL
jgi:hypothetical protein